MASQTVATMAAGLLLATYALPAYADQSTPNSSLPVAPGNAPQNFGATVTLSIPRGPRDTYAVTEKPRSVIVRSPAYQSANRQPGTFRPNPANLIIQWPLAQSAPISSGFGPRTSPCQGCSTFHTGLDINPGAGTPIYAVADGVVAAIGNPIGSYGVFAIIDHMVDGQKISSLYGHMKQGSLALSIGQQVRKGQLVGNVGNTGASSGAHLHLGLYLNGNIPIDPTIYLKAKIGS